MLSLYDNLTHCTLYKNKYLFVLIYIYLYLLVLNFDVVSDTLQMCLILSQINVETKNMENV